MQLRRDPFSNESLALCSGYLETCAAVGLVLFAHQMARINPRKMDYADAMEIALYNAVQVGVSLDGKKFFYDNPLAVNDEYLERKEWFDVACCPANVSASAFFASMAESVF